MRTSENRQGEVRSINLPHSSVNMEQVQAPPDHSPVVPST
jgi:hypothetical protein